MVAAASQKKNKTEISILVQSTFDLVKNLKSPLLINFLAHTVFYSAQFGKLFFFKKTTDFTNKSKVDCTTSGEVGWATKASVLPSFFFLRPWIEKRPFWGLESHHPVVNLRGIGWAYTPKKDGEGWKKKRFFSSKIRLSFFPIFNICYW